MNQRNVAALDELLDEWCVVPHTTPRELGAWLVSRGVLVPSAADRAAIHQAADGLEHWADTGKMPFATSHARVLADALRAATVQRQPDPLPVNHLEPGVVYDDVGAQTFAGFCEARQRAQRQAEQGL